jgi:hypothetical protein
MMQHNGRIDVSSPETGGATFTLAFGFNKEPGAVEEIFGI